MHLILLLWVFTGQLRRFPDTFQEEEAAKEQARCEITSRLPEALKPALDPCSLEEWL